MATGERIFTVSCGGDGDTDEVMCALLGGGVRKPG